VECNQFKNEIIAEICAVMSFSAISNNDKVGAILFSDSVELYIPPKKGKKHILRIIRELVDNDIPARGTNLKKALTYLNNVQKKRAIVFIISDFLTSDYEDDLRLAGKRHDIIGIRVYDRREEELPNVGLIRAIDSESGKKQVIDTASGDVRLKYNEWYQKNIAYLNDCFVKAKSEIISIRTDHDYVKLLMQFFKKRLSRLSLKMFVSRL